MSLRDLLLHLRLDFALTLAPLFLWGHYLAGGVWDGAFWRAFIAFHVFLYGGANAYNSYYDRDTGPIGGLSRPPAITAALRNLALVMKAAGLLLALPVNLPFVLLYACFLGLSIAYSHPAIRWKADPVRSTAAVAFGQGILGYSAGWSAADGSLGGLLQAPGLLGLAGAALFTAGFYPLTQVYQMDADRRRGDRTLALLLGARGVFVFSNVLIAAGALSLGLLLFYWGTPAEAGGLAAYLVMVVVLLTRWGCLFRAEDVRSNFRLAMLLQYGNAACLAGFLLVRAWLGLPLVRP